MVLLDSILDKLGKDKEILLDMVNIIHDEKSRKILPLLSLNPIVYDAMPYDKIQCSKPHTLLMLHKMKNVGWIKTDLVDTKYGCCIKYTITDDGLKTVHKLFTEELKEVTPIVIKI